MPGSHLTASSNPFGIHTHSGIEIFNRIFTCTMVYIGVLPYKECFSFCGFQQRLSELSSSFPLIWYILSRARSLIWISNMPASRSTCEVGWRARLRWVSFPRSHVSCRIPALSMAKASLECGDEECARVRTRERPNKRVDMVRPTMIYSEV